MDIIIFGGVQMGKKRNQYTKEFKIEAVRLILEEGRRIAELARELGVGENLLSRSGFYAWLNRNRCWRSISQRTMWA